MNEDETNLKSSGKEGDRSAEVEICGSEGSSAAQRGKTVEGKSNGSRKVDDGNNNDDGNVDNDEGDIREAEADKHDDQKGLDLGENDSVEKGNSNGGSLSVGRRGDPRMHKAVAARLANPNLSLLEALIIGGFEFPKGTDGDGMSDRTIYDADNVLLCQRKNQLSRRLRLARRRSDAHQNHLQQHPHAGGDLDSLNPQEQGQVPSADKMNHNQQQDSNTSENQSLKRPHDGAGEQQPQLGSAERVSGDMYSNAAMPQPNISTLLQQPVGMGQAPAYFNGNNYVGLPQQSFGNPYLASGHFPMNYGMNMSHGFQNGNLGQSAQSPLDRYLAIAASTMGMNPQSILLAQSNLAGNIGNQQQSQQQERNHKAPQPGLENSGKISETSSAGDKDSSGNDDQEGEEKDNVTEDRRKVQLDRAVEIFNSEKSSLCKRCLVMAGFTDEEIQSKQEILNDFKELIKKKS